MSAPRPIIIDTDPGQDDAVAILLALASPELDVRGIVTVAGNVGLKQNSINARKIIELASRTDVPVHAGSAAPLRRNLVTAEHVHGKTGLDGSNLPDPSFSLASHDGVAFLIKTILESPEPITLCALGPLTNIADAISRAPEILPYIRQLVLMGGAYFEVGNITPAAEFNIYVDPEAADIVFHSGLDIVVLPLDVTHQALATLDRLEKIRAIGNRSGDTVAGMLHFSERFDLEKYGWQGAPLHDPTVIAYLLQPDLFSGRKINIEIETKSDLTRGMTVADYWQITDREKNALYLRNIDASGFFELLTDRLKRLP
ncbi:MAG: nucleoside hydrolase [Hyphomicrobiaceae bacterium]|nr:nucleoside hydrolase [Hyphomicrobiaceae bacterium]